MAAGSRGQGRRAAERADCSGWADSKQVMLSWKIAERPAGSCTRCWVPQLRMAPSDNRSCQARVLCAP